MEFSGNELRQMNLSRLAKILFNLSILALVLTLGGVMGFLFIGIYYFAIAMVVLVTVFSILIVKPDIFSSADAAMEWWTNAFSKSIWYIAAITIVLCIVTIILLKKDKTQNNKGRIAGEIAMIVIAVIALIIKIAQVVGGN